MNDPYGDADVLDRAALVLTKRSRKPRSIWLRVLCNVLESTADDIRKEAAA